MAAPTAGIKQLLKEIASMSSPKPLIVVPLHVSGIWVPYYAENPLEAGSIGAGLNLSLYLNATFQLGPCSIVLNGESLFSEQAEKICKSAGVNIKTTATAPLTLGRGFGVSAAILIAHSIATHIATSRPLLRALQAAHVLEVEYGTGLGDVIAEYTGGFAIRLKPGAPGIGFAYRIILRERVDLVVIELGELEPTKAMLSRMKPEDYGLGKVLLEKVIENEDLKTFFECSKRFTSKLFNYTRVGSIVDGLPGIVDYYLKKSALVVWIEREYAWDILEELRRRGIKALHATISSIGVSIAHSTKSP
ncbi:MAG: kinase [Desulfurococcaceae archaeon]